MDYINLTIICILYHLDWTIIYIFHTHRTFRFNRDPILYTLFMILMLTLQFPPFCLNIIQTNNALFFFLLMISLAIYFHSTI